MKISDSRIGRTIQTIFADLDHPDNLVSASSEEYWGVYEVLRTCFSVNRVLKNLFKRPTAIKFGKKVRSMEQFYIKSSTNRYKNVFFTQDHCEYRSSLKTDMKLLLNK